MRRCLNKYVFYVGLIVVILTGWNLGTAVGAPKDEFPIKGKAISIIVPFPAGSANDMAARIQGPALEKELGVPIVVLNKPGASTQIGMTQLAQAKPDGYTLGLLTLPGAMLAYLGPSRKAIYSRKDFNPIGLQSWDPNALGVKADSPYKSLKDLVEAAKSNPEKIKAGTSGLLSTDHMVLLLTEKITGVKFAIAHFDGSPQSFAALLGGHLDAVVTTSSIFRPHVKSERVRMLGITDKEENPFFPGVKTFDVQGYKIYYGASRGIVVRSDTPREILDILAAAVKKATDDPDVKKRMHEMGLTLRYMDEKRAGIFWDELEAQTKPLLELAK